MKNTIRPLLLLASTILLLHTPAAAVSRPAGTISNVRVTNLSDKGFTVSWTTNVA